MHGGGKRLASGGALESIRKEISAVREKAHGQTEETNAERKNGTDVRTDGQTDRQTDRHAGRNENNNTRWWPWAISVSKEGRHSGGKKRVEFVICKSHQSPASFVPRTRVRNRRLMCRPRGLFREGFGNRGTEIRILCDAVARPPRLSNPLFSRDCTGRENVSGVYRDTVTEFFYRHPFESCMCYACDYISFRIVDLNPHFMLRLIVHFVNWYN